MKKTKRRREKK